MSTFNNRWIKLHESLAEWEWFDHPYMLKLWIYLLIRANYTDIKWHGIVVPRGSLVTSLDKLSDALNISVQQVRTGLAKLIDNKQITSESTSQYRIISICNYGIYQLKETSEQQAENCDDNKQITTSKEEYILSPLI